MEVLSNRSRVVVDELLIHADQRIQQSMKCTINIPLSPLKLVSLSGGMPDRIEPPPGMTGRN